MAQAMYMTMNTLTNSKTCSWNPKTLMHRQAWLMFTGLKNGILVKWDARNASNRNDRTKSPCEKNRKMPILPILHNPAIIPRPTAAMRICSMANDSLELFCCIASREVEDETARIENMMRKKTIIQMILSPSSLSSMFQNPVFFAFVPIFVS